MMIRMKVELLIFDSKILLFLLGIPYYLEDFLNIKPHKNSRII